MSDHGIDDLLHFGEQAVASGQLRFFAITIEAWKHTDDEGTVEGRDVELRLTRPGEDRMKILSVRLDDWRVDKKRARFLEHTLPQLQRFVETGE